MQYVRCLFYSSEVNFIINVTLNLMYITIKKDSHINYFILNKNLGILNSKTNLYLLTPYTYILNNCYNYVNNLYFNHYILYSLKIEILGIGYRFLIVKSYLYIFLGYSHLIKIILPTKIKAQIDTKKLIVSSNNKYILGNVFFFLKRLRKFDVYSNKGIKRIYDRLITKTGKSKIVNK